MPARLRAAVLDITGEVVVREERAAAVDAAQGRGVDPAVVVELVLATIARSPYPVLGIGIGTPGLVDRDGTVRTAPNLGWTDVPLQRPRRRGHRPAGAASPTTRMPRRRPS